MALHRIQLGVAAGPRTSIVLILPAETGRFTLTREPVSATTRLANVPADRLIAARWVLTDRAAQLLSNGAATVAGGGATLDLQVETAGDVLYGLLTRVGDNAGGDAYVLSACDRVELPSEEKSRWVTLALAAARRPGVRDGRRGHRDTEHAAQPSAGPLSSIGDRGRDDREGVIRSLH